MFKSHFKTILNENYQGEVLSQEQTESVQRCLITILQEVVDVCNKYGIKPFLAGGNLLGKVRHGGFIPWDDDLDIGLLRKDYEKFISIMENELSDRYVFSSPVGDFRARSRFVKLGRKGTKLISGYGEKYDENDANCHIFIDIFPFDYTPENNVIRKIKKLYCNGLMAIAGSSQFKDVAPAVKDALKKSTSGRIELILREILARLFSFRSSENWMRSVDRAVRSSKKSGLIGCNVGRVHYAGELVNTVDFLPLHPSEYCGVKLYEIKNPDAYLTSLYGDYMQIPPPEKRETHHAVAVEVL